MSKESSAQKGICPYCGHEIVVTLRKVIFDPWRRVSAILMVGEKNPHNTTAYDTPFVDGFHCVHCKLHFDEMPPVFVERVNLPAELHPGFKRCHQPLPAGSPNPNASAVEAMKKAGEQAGAENLSTCANKESGLRPSGPFRKGYFGI